MNDRTLNDWLAFAAITILVTIFAVGLLLEDDTDIGTALVCEQVNEQIICTEQ